MKKLTIVLILSINLLFAVSAEEIFKKCAGCHGKDATMSALNKSRKIVNWDKDRIVQALKEYRAGKRDLAGGGIMMKHATAKLSDKEIEDVAKYIVNLKKSQ